MGRGGGGCRATFCFTFGGGMRRWLVREKVKKQNKDKKEWMIGQFEESLFVVASCKD